MSHLETVRSIYDAYLRGDIAFIVRQLAEDVVWEEHLAEARAPWLIPGRGSAHARRFFGVVASDLSFEHFAVTQLLEGGDQVVALVSLRAKVKSTGKVLEDHEAHVWTFGNDGQVRAFRHLSDTFHHHAVANA